MGDGRRLSRGRLSLFVVRSNDEERDERPPTTSHALWDTPNTYLMASPPHVSSFFLRFVSLCSFVEGGEGECLCFPLLSALSLPSGSTEDRARRGETYARVRV